MTKHFLILISTLFLIAGCSYKTDIEPQKQQDTVVVSTIVPPVLEKIKTPNLKDIVTIDDRNDTDFLIALDKSINYYNTINANTKFNFGDRNISARDMASGLAKFKKIVQKNQSFSDFLLEVNKNFDVYSSKNAKNSALITGYYAPIIKGSLIETEQFPIPVYGLPSNRVMVSDENGTKKPMCNISNKMSTCPNHADIANGAMKNETPLFWVENPAERFFLAIQGSGIIELPDGKKLNIGYAGGNGWPYASMGKYFGQNKLLPSDQISTQSMKAYLAKLPHSEAQAILNNNPNFVFFKIQDKKGVFGNIGIALTKFASVAMDSNKIPKGALAYVKTKVPYKTEENQTTVPKTQRKPWENFVMVQDTGGAITGGGRVDIYCGEGEDAYFYAGQMAEQGEVYLFAPKN